jgi:hypothetical protein
MARKGAENTFLQPLKNKLYLWQNLCCITKMENKSKLSKISYFQWFLAMENGPFLTVTSKWCDLCNNLTSTVSGSSTPGTAGRRLQSKILDMIYSRQQQTAGESYTSYQIWLHHSGLKRRGHQPKRNWTWEQSTPSLFLVTIDVGMQDFVTKSFITTKPI